MSYEPETFAEWFAKLPIKAERSTAELSWRTAWAESEKYSESLYVEMIAGRDKRIAALTEVLTEAHRLVNAYICPPDGHSAGCIEIAEALADEQEGRS